MRKLARGHPGSQEPLLYLRAHAKRHFHKQPVVGWLPSKWTTSLFDIQRRISPSAFHHVVWSIFIHAILQCPSARDSKPGSCFATFAHKRTASFVFCHTVWQLEESFGICELMLSSRERVYTTYYLLRGIYAARLRRPQHASLQHWKSQSTMLGLVKAASQIMPCIYVRRRGRTSPNPPVSR